jgi:hypothetical protein
METFNLFEDWTPEMLELLKSSKRRNGNNSLTKEAGL